MKKKKIDHLMQFSSTHSPFLSAPRLFLVYFSQMAENAFSKAMKQFNSPLGDKATV